jgi:cytochrome c553
MRLVQSALLVLAALALAAPAARADQKDPGPATGTKETCLACHDEFGGKAPVRVGKGKSHPVKGECVGCHNPHNSKKKKLLL